MNDAARDAGQEPPARFACANGARWLPRTLAGAVLSAACLFGYNLDPRVFGATQYRFFLVALGGVIALWIIRRGAELRSIVELDADGLRWIHGTRTIRLDYARIDSVSFEPPFAASRNWVPALVLLDPDSLYFRVPALLANGTGFIDELVRRAGSSQLEARAEGLRSRMGRAGVWTAGGYLLSASIVVTSLSWIFRG